MLCVECKLDIRTTLTGEDGHHGYAMLECNHTVCEKCLIKLCDKGTRDLIVVSFDCTDCYAKTTLGFAKKKKTEHNDVFSGQTYSYFTHAALTCKPHLIFCTSATSTQPNVFVLSNQCSS